MAHASRTGHPTGFKTCSPGTGPLHNQVIMFCHGRSGDRLPRRETELILSNSGWGFHAIILLARQFGQQPVLHEAVGVFNRDDLMPHPALVIPAAADQSLFFRCIACSSTQPQEKGHISRLSHSTKFTWLPSRFIYT